jgi:hypothetical protein
LPNPDPIRIQISDKNFEKMFDSHVRGLNEYSCAHEAHIKFGDVTPYLIYGLQGQKTI